MNSQVVRNAFQKQAEACDALGSPFTARLCRLAGERLRHGSSIGDEILAWPGDPSPAADSVPLRLAGSLHALVLTGRNPTLSSVYPPNAADDEALWEQVSAALAAESAFLLERLQSPPQTNEVRRSAALLPGFSTLSSLFDMPLVLSEVGASAGLNLQWDRYRYRLGDQFRGEPQSAVQIVPEWRGANPPMAEISVASRAGCDLMPVDARDPEQRLRMLSYIWADQADRLARTRAALDIAGASGLRIDKADAVDWLRTRLAMPFPGAVHVIFNTIAWQYLPEESQQTGKAMITAAGEKATRDAPLAWLQMEADGRPDGASLTLQIWPTGERREIGRADFHGRWVDWKGWEN